MVGFGIDLGFNGLTTLPGAAGAGATGTVAAGAGATGTGATGAVVAGVAASLFLMF